MSLSHDVPADEDRPLTLRERWIGRDLACALALHRASARPYVLMLLVAVSRVGDGMLWYALAVLLPWIAGPAGWACTLQMLAVGVVNLLLYWTLKHRVARPRPFVTHADIRCCTRPLDPFSFPSGHTLHAVSFTTLISYHFPSFAPLAWAATALIALSRVVLGLHYPSDVVVGAVIGVLTASMVLLAN